MGGVLLSFKAPLGDFDWYYVQARTKSGNRMDTATLAWLYRT